MKKELLIAALETVKPGLANKELIEQSTSFAFVDGRVVTYNDEISISHPVAGLELTGAIQATELYAILKKLKQEEIEITLTETEVLLTAGKVKVGLVLQTEVKLPITEIGEIKKWKTLPEGFNKAMQMALMCTSTNSTKPVLTCVHITKDAIEGTDDFRLYKTELKTSFIVDEGNTAEDILIPSTSVSVLLKFGATKISLTSGWVHFKNTVNGAILSCRTFADAFPDTSKILKIKGKEIKFPKTIDKILDRAAVFGKYGSKITDEEVHIALGAKRITVSAKSETGRFEEVANVDYNGESIVFNIMPSLLKGVLNEEYVCLYKEGTLRFEGTDWVFFTLLKG